jgi:signal transduction histidine kinase
MIAAMRGGTFVAGSWSRALSFGGIAILILIEITTAQRLHPSGATLAGIVAAMAVITGAWVLLVQRYQPDRQSSAGPALIVVIGVGAIVLVALSPQGAAIIAAIVALSAAANRFSRRTGVAYAAVLIAAYIAAISFRIGFQAVSVLSYGLGLTFAFMAARSIAELRSEQARTKLLLRELQESRDAHIQSAAMSERARIAREIHDVLAHTLAALAVQLEGARLMLEQRHTDPEALASVERAHRLAKEGLEETRRAVSALRGDRIPGPDQLGELIDEFRRDAGTHAAFRVEGEARDLGPEAKLALYRTAQEALTNVRKHAQADQVDVVLRYAPEGTELLVIDAGKSRVAAGAGGFGLLGMRERAELLGGTLEVKSDPAQGTLLRLRFPAAP